MPVLKILSYNIHKGFTIGNRRFVLEHIRDAIRSLPADIVFLQEVLGHHGEHARKVANWPIMPQFEYLADEVWPHFAYGKNAVYDSGHHGNAILSKYPIVDWSNIDLSTNRFEQRGCLHASIMVPGVPRPLHALCLHLNLLHRSRESQIQAVCGRITSAIPETDPFILAGDFNDWGGRISPLLQQHTSATEVFQATNGRYASSYPSRFPVLKLDRIYTRGTSPVSAKVLTGKPWSDLSDHAALYGEVLI